jgi:hypothetical protein
MFSTNKIVEQKVVWITTSKVSFTLYDPVDKLNFWQISEHKFPRCVEDYLEIP